jgi:UDP-glucose 4-epimerase
MKRCLVSGAGGFIGANLVRHLLAAGHQVHALVRPQEHVWRLDGLGPSITLHHVDIGDAGGVRGAVDRIRPEWVFHLAVHGAYSWQTDLRRMIDVNITGTVNLLEACADAGVAAFVNTGSSSEYGFKTQPPSESDFIDPNSYYALTKAFATHYCRYTALSKDLAVSTLRLYSVYGPFEDPGRLFPALICHGLRGTLPPLVSPTIARDYVHVDDVCRAYVEVAASGRRGEVYNVATGVQTSLAELVELVRSLLGITARPEWGTMPDRAWDSSNWVGDASKLESSLHWRPALTLRDGVAGTIDWFRATPHLTAEYARR